MFNFLKKKIDLADVPLSEIKFSDKDLFVLMGGLDLGSLVLNPRRFPWVDVEQGDAVETWRKTVVNRYEQPGHVDSEGKPVGELARLLYPLAKPGLVITGSRAGSLTSTDIEMAIFEDRATIVRSAPGSAGFTLEDAGASDAWASAFMRAFGLEGRFTPAPEPWHVDFLMNSTDKGLNSILLEKDVEEARSFAARKGFDAAPVIGIIERLKTSRSLVAVKLTALDMRNAVLEPIFTPSGTFTSFAPADESPVDMRVKRMTLLPEYGWATSETTAPREGLPADWRDHPEYKLLSRFFSGDLLATDDLFDFATDVRDCPAELGGVPSGQPCRAQ